MLIDSDAFNLKHPLHYLDSIFFVIFEKMCVMFATKCKSVQSLFLYSFIWR